MGPAKVVPLADVWAMLNHCAAGWTKRETDHYWQVTFGKECYPSLPKGSHGSRRPDVETGHVRSLSRQFSIYECAKDFLHW